ncbi:MAG: hypothetical protein J6A29_03870 [Clostridia bacterium]|nr:hypothetical protein [Clostridia bacterium]
MSEFARSLDSLAEFFREQDRSDPEAAVAEVVKVLDHCLNPRSNSKGRSFILKPNEFLGVQQFVNSFGCHLEHVSTFLLNGTSDYTIEKNW